MNVVLYKKEHFIYLIELNNFKLSDDITPIICPITDNSK